MLNSLICLVVYTANILGSFNDPFEFEGDYGSEVNPVRQQVFELVVSKEALAKNLADAEKDQNAVVTQRLNSYKRFLIDRGRRLDREHGPSLAELVTPPLLDMLAAKQRELPSFTEAELQNLTHFVHKYGNEKIFYFLRNYPSELLSLDKILRDRAARAGKTFDLPILSSTQVLTGQNASELKADLLQVLFTEDILEVTKPPRELLLSLEKAEKTDRATLQKLLGDKLESQELAIFCTPAGQVFFYWLYQSLNLHLIAQDQAMIEQVNRTKEIFARTMADADMRARTFKDKLISTHAGVVFTQESDASVPQMLSGTLSGDQQFLSVDKQNPDDGTFVFLRSDLWQPDYEVVPITGYKGYAKGRLNVILATHRASQIKFLLASCHGNSTEAKDGRLQISLVVDKWRELSQKPENAGLQLLIGIDANTKSEEDVHALRQHVDDLGLTTTSVGPTTIKKRMVTAQHAKAGRVAVDEEDYLITLKPENGGLSVFTHVTVGFSEEKPDTNRSLPNLDNLSDHYPVGATLEPVTHGCP